MEQIKDLLIILISSSLVSNVVLSQFLGLCPFLGVSKKVETATGMGGAVIFVITLASVVTGCIYKFLLAPFDLGYLQTIVFILVIAALVQFVEMFLAKAMPALHQALGIYLPLITTNCAVFKALYGWTLPGTWCISSVDYNKLCGLRCRAYECTEGIRYITGNGKRICNSTWFYHCYCNSSRIKRKNGME